MTSAEMVVVGMKHIVCFSGGHSSAIAAVEVVRKFGAEDTILLNHDLCPRTEDADIKRFKKQVSDYLGVPITYANMPGWYVKDQFDVCMEIKAFKAGAQSTAFCTNRLKTEPFHKWLSEHYPANPPEVRDDISLVYGFDANEQHRIRRRVGIMAAMGYQTEYPLTWEVRTIHDIEEVGIERPKTYSIFNHANCTGCLKAGKQHWFVVYSLYPKIWEKAKLAEDTIGYSILKQGYLSDFEVAMALINRAETMDVKHYIDYAIQWMVSQGMNPLLCYPDEGAAKRYSELLPMEYVFCIKHRDWRTGKIERLELTEPEKVNGRNILIVDDICSRGGTFTHTAKALKEAGAEEVMLYVTHYENTILKGTVLTDGLISRVFATDSILRIDHEKISICR